MEDPYDPQIEGGDGVLDSGTVHHQTVDHAWHVSQVVSRVQPRVQQQQQQSYMVPTKLKFPVNAGIFW